MSITLYNQYIYKNGEWKLVGTSIDPPTKTSDLTNDSGFITAADIPVESVNGETGAVVLDAADVGAQAAITANGILKGNGSGTITAATAGTDYQAPLPSQTGNSGKYLTTNGTAMSWGEVDALPSQTGNSGKFLTTDGTDASWTSITQDDHKWGTATLDRTQEGIANDTYVPQFDSTSDTTAKLAIATKTPANYAVAKYDGSAYLHSTTPTSSDNSTKVATTAYVDTAVGAITYPVTSVNTKTGAVSLTASDVGALPDDTTIPQGTVTSVRVQATSPVQSSTNTIQSTTLNTTISLADSYGDTKNPYAAKAKNTVLAGPSTGTATAPSFRTLEADDIPSLTVSKISDFPSTMTPSSHTHGNITNAGDITTTATIASGDRLVINDESASKVTNSSITFGTSETTYLTNKGTWKTPDYPVTSVNTKTGAVSLTASDVGALPDTTEVPTATSDLTNDSGFITSSDIPVTSVNTKTGAVSLSASDVGALPDSTDVTKWNGVELNKSGGSTSQNIYIPYVTATVYAGASTTPTGNYIAKYDANSYLHSTTPSASDNSTKVATTAYVDSAINELGSLLTFKGVVATTGDLPGSGNDVGDVWVVSEDNSEHVWTGEAWERLGTTVDLSGYVPTSRTVNNKALSTDITLSASDVSALPDSTDVTKWGTATLGRGGANLNANTYVPQFESTTATSTDMATVTYTPTNYAIVKYDGSSYLHSTTPSASDNSNKVATTAYVTSAVGAITVPVTSVNSKTGAVVLTAADVGALPDSTEIPTATSDLTNDSGFITINDVPAAPVTSVNTKTGAVTLTASDVGALPDSTSIPTATSDLTNDSGFITANDIPQEIFIAEYGTETFANIRAAHVAGKIVFTIDGAKIFRLIYCTTTSIVFVRNTGSPSVEVVTVSTADEWASEYINAQSEITASGILKGDGAGGVTAAVAGTDYQAPISNNVTGSGTSGYLAKFNGTNTVTSGPALGSATTTFLRNDGSWATPAGTYSLPTASTSAKGGIIVGSGLTMSTDTLNHASSITAGTAGTSSATSGATLAVPYVTYNATGHITAAGTHTHTINGLGVSAGGTGATTFTSGYALIGNGANAITTRAITNNTATSSAVTASTNLVTMNTLRYATNRTTSVAAADTGYTTLMARGESLNTADTTPAVNGAIAWTYS